VCALIALSSSDKIATFPFPYKAKRAFLDSYTIDLIYLLFCARPGIISEKFSITISQHLTHGGETILEEV
jgi:hypothetical protein